eukprot:4971599-Alexandrium_andersonii.AAC.1
MGVAVPPCVDGRSGWRRGHPALTRGPRASARAGWQHRQGLVGLASVGRGRNRHGSARQGAQRRQVPTQ